MPLPAGISTSNTAALPPDSCPSTRKRTAMPLPRRMISFWPVSIVLWCECRRVAWRRRARASGRAGGPTGLLLACGRFSWSGGGLEGDRMAERFELFDKSAGAVFGGVAAGEPVGAEFAEGDALGDDVVVGDQDVVACGADRFRIAAAAADLPCVGGEVGVFGAGGGVGGLDEGCAQPGVAVAGFAGEASVAGLVGAGADRGPGDEVLAASEDAHVDAALGDQHLRGAQLDAGDGADQLDELGVGGGCRLDAGVEGEDGVVEGVDLGEQTGDQDAVVGGV